MIALAIGLESLRGPISVAQKSESLQSIPGAN